MSGELLVGLLGAILAALAGLLGLVARSRRPPPALPTPERTDQAIAHGRELEQVEQLQAAEDAAAEHVDEVPVDAGDQVDAAIEMARRRRGRR